MRFEPVLRRMQTLPFIVGLALTLVFAYGYLDRPLAQFFHDAHLRERLFFLAPVTILTKSSSLLVLLGCVTLYFQWIKPIPRIAQRLWYLLLCVFLVSLLCLVLKIALGRARPILWFDLHVYGFYGLQWASAYWSCPSGHSMAGMGLAMGLLFLFPAYASYFLGMALCIGAMRVLLYYHYLSDVLLSFYLAPMLVFHATCRMRRLSFLGITL